jgi:hypothetical protein
MIALSHWMEPAPWGNTLRQTASEGAAPPHLTFPQGDYGATTTVNDQLTHLLIQLAKHMRERCLELDRSTNTFARYLQLMNGLQGKFEIGVYNLNYDTLALSARSGAFTGFASSGKFNANAVLQRQEWNFVYHLHGSVHYSLNHSFGDQIEWRDLAGEFVYGHRGLSTDERSDGKSLPKTALIAGGFKLDQLLVEPFHTHHAALARHIYEADAILIGGYGFGDVHVNWALRNRLAGLNGGNRPPVMVLNFSAPNTNPMQFRGDIWANELCRTLYTSGNSFREPGHSSTPVISELLQRAAFEVAEPHRVAIWHGGFIEAGARLESMLQWLDGAGDQVLANS